MQKENISSKINPKILITLGAFLVIFIVVFFVSLLTKPSEVKQTDLTPTPVRQQIPPDAVVPSPEIKTPQSVIINRLGETTFGVFKSSYPTTANTYSFTSQMIASQQIQSIAKSLSFTTKPTTGQSTTGLVYSFIEGGSTLEIYPDLGSVQYFGVKIAGERKINSLSDAATFAKAGVKVLEPLSDGLTADLSNIQMYIGTGDLKETRGISNAEIYNVPFVQKINSLPVYTQFGSAATANIWINKSGEVIRITFTAPGPLTAAQSKNLLTIAEAKQKIINGEGIISSYGPPNDYGTFPTPEKTFLENASVAYFKDFQNGYLYPIFVFTGTATNDNQSLPITVYLPASR